MVAEKISIETLKDEIENKRVCLTLESDNINNVMSPIRCNIEFESLSINIIHPASIHLYGDEREVRLSQINYIYRENKYENTVYILNCGKFAQTNKDYILKCL